MPFPELSTPENFDTQHPPDDSNRPGTITILKHLGLFVATFICVSFTGAIFWVGQTAHADGFLSMLPEGVLFATVFLLFLGTHEFGHYFAAQYHHIKVSLPYFIPIPVGIGTFGAVIRIREQINDTIKLFDVGIAGPIAGFLVSIATLLYGFATLPGPEYMSNFLGHEEIIAYVSQHGVYPDSPLIENGNMLMVMGNTIMYDFLAGFFDHVPPMWEMYHFPFLFAGWLGLFFTALNLVPIGQLDGGHILYSLTGYRIHQRVARTCFAIMTSLGGIEAIPFIHSSLSQWVPSLPFLSISIWALVLLFLARKAYHNDIKWILPAWAGSLLFSLAVIFLSENGMDQSGSLIWVFWSFILTYFIGIEHPPVRFEQPLTPTRKVLGWTSMAIFVFCISPNPIYFLN